MVRLCEMVKIAGVKIEEVVGAHWADSCHYAQRYEK
jgi:hypothetical protein